MSRYKKPAEDIRKGDMLVTPFDQGLIVTSVRRKGSKIRICARPLGGSKRRVCDEYAPDKRVTYET